MTPTRAPRFWRRSDVPPQQRQGPHVVLTYVPSGSSTCTAGNASEHCRESGQRGTRRPRRVCFSRASAGCLQRRHALVRDDARPQLLRVLWPVSELVWPAAVLAVVVAALVAGRWDVSQRH